MTKKLYSGGFKAPSGQEYGILGAGPSAGMDLSFEARYRQENGMISLHEELATLQDSSSARTTELYQKQEVSKD